jgi:hypothetical protein
VLLLRSCEELARKRKRKRKQKKHLGEGMKSKRT